MSSEMGSHDEVTRLRSLLGVMPDVADGVAQLTPRDEVVLARLLAEEVGDRAASRPRPRRSPLVVRFAVALVATAAATVGLAVWNSTQTPSAAQTPSMLVYSDATIADVIQGAAPDGVPILRALSASAHGQPVDQGLGIQRITSYAWYLNVVVDEEGDSKIELAPTFQVTTLAPDGSATNSETRLPALGIDGRVIDPDRYPAGGAESLDEFPAGTADPSYPQSLPRDPQALRSLLLDANGASTCCESDVAAAACLYFEIVNLNSQWVIPSDLAAALWAMLAEEPGVVSLGSVTDRLGRQGVALAMPPSEASANQVLVFVVDPEDGSLLQWETVALGLPGEDLLGPVVSSFQAFASAVWTPVP